MGCRSSKHGFSKVRVSESARSGTNSVTSSSRKLFSRKIRSVTSWSSGQWNSTVLVKTPDTCDKTVKSAPSRELQFTDFCTTKATYNVLGSKTSTITVRLSSDGSTLQIEQCEMPLLSSMQRSESAPCLGCKGKRDNKNINKTFTVAAQMNPFSAGNSSDQSEDSGSKLVQAVEIGAREAEVTSGEMKTDLSPEKENVMKMNGTIPQDVTHSDTRTPTQRTCTDENQIHVSAGECTCLLQDEINKNCSSPSHENNVNETEDGSDSMKHLDQDVSNNNNLNDGCSKLKYSVGKILHCYKSQVNENAKDLTISYERIPARDGNHCVVTEATVRGNVTYTTDTLTNDLDENQWADCDNRNLFDCTNPSLCVSLSPAGQPEQFSGCGLYDGEYPNSGDGDNTSSYSASAGQADLQHLNETKDLIMANHDVPQCFSDFNDYFVTI